ncbi:fructose PTS transporter subunit IIA [Crassaminicella indica]|uniref:Fructose PTS transporter subunit IIA n=1 Tax=Crassaminicella indica TaxID=2855394 RepID=A0ABX8RC98_9CLOT|nr:fructose PTS transporter subunit IIA [Crassaminicella indica]QXM05350.1 fructose PTS transporter subunit IIA [Crassaminicella indica]
MEKIINTDLIDLNLKAETKEEAIKTLIKRVDKCGRLNDINEYLKVVLEREKLSTTGIGFGIAIPHGKSDAVKIPTLAFGRCEDGIEWQSLDGKVVKIIFLIAVPEEAASNQHLRILAALSRRMMNEEFRKKLLEIVDEKELMNLLDDILAEIAA